MSYYFYNAETRPDFGKTKILNARPYDEGTPSGAYYNLYLKEAYANKEIALTQTFQGPIAWFEGDTLYIGHLNPEWCYKPISDTPVCDMGINWATMYFKTKESAEEWEKTCYTRHDPIGYKEDADVYFVHYHL